MLFYVCGQNFVSVACKSTAVQHFTRIDLFGQKTGEHDLSLTSITFDPG